LKLAGEAIRQANAKLFLAFRPVTVKKRTLNRIAGGVVTLGDEDPPIEVYQGPTARDRVKPLSGKQSAIEGCGDRPINNTESPIVSDREEKSLGNVSRADSRPTIVNETAGVGLVLCLLPKTIAFNGDAVLDLVEPGLYRKHRRRS
jgi:hypothetical protein